MESPESSTNKYFQKKQEQEDELKSKERKLVAKKFTRWLGAVLILGVLIWGIYSFFKNQGPTVKPGEFFEAQSRDHIASGTSHADYNSNPPTGGWHYDQPAQSGIYDKEFPDEQLIHNLEHGHIWIAYRPDLSKEQINQLVEIAKDYGSKIIMAPRTNNPTPIAVMAWEYLLKLDTFDDVKIREFIEAHRGNGPERIPDFGFKDFRVTQ